MYLKKTLSIKAQNNGGIVFNNHLSLLFTIALLWAPAAQSTDKTFKELTQTLSAFAKVVNESSQLEGRNEKETFLSPAADKKFQTMNSDLEKCKEEKITEPREVIIRKDGIESSFKTFHIKIYGPECPFNITAKVDIKDQQESSFKAIVEMSFAVLDPTLELKYKVKQVNLNGELNGEITKNGNLVGMIANANLVSNGTTTDHGPFRQIMKFDINTSIDLATFNFNAEMNQLGRIEYKDLNKSGSGKVTMIGFGNQPTEVYEIDGKPATISEYTEFMESFVAVGSIEEDDPNNPEGKNPTMCDAVVYKSSAMNADNLKNILSKKLPRPPEGLVYQKSSCKNVTETSGQTSHGFEFAEKWITFKSTTLGNFDNDAIFTLYKDKSPQVRSEKDYTVGLICEPIPKCQ